MHPPREQTVNKGPLKSNNNRKNHIKDTKMNQRKDTKRITKDITNRLEEIETIGRKRNNKKPEQPNTYITYYLKAAALLLNALERQ
jgi:hypothetical protein